MFNIDNIEFSPKIIYWFEMPSIITNDIKIELLKRDILLEKCGGKYGDIIEEITKEKNKYAIYLFNIDWIILENVNEEKNRCIFLRKIINLIEKHVPDSTFVYSKSNDCKIDYYCNKAQIKHKIDTLFNNKESIISNIVLFISPIFKKAKMKNRSFLRLIFFPHILHKIEFPKIRLDDSISVKGYLKDLSLNGMAIILFDTNVLSLFEIGNKVKLKIYLPENEITIENAIVIRKSPKEKLVCVNFEINDIKMINEEESKKIIDLVSKYIKDFF